jgi:SAM-dependent methyltransferase
MKQWDSIYRKGGYKYYDVEVPHEDMKTVASFLKSRKCREILDLGCGVGRNLIYLLKQGFSVHGLDYSPTAIRKLKSTGIKNVTVADMFSRLKYPSGSFDAIISVQSLQHGRKEQITRAIKELGRVLKPKGLIFITLAGRISRGKVRLCLVKTARKIAPNTFVPTMGDEIGLVHFIFNRPLIRKQFSGFKILRLWKDSRDYYCFIAEKKRDTP